jgi:hypothetical protein
MADVSGDPVPFKWYTAAMPSIGWDAAFLAPADLLEHPEKYERIPVRALSKLRINDKKQLEVDKNLPGCFGAQDFNSPGVLDRKLTCWIFEATPAAAEDWTRAWTDPTVDANKVLVATENDAEIVQAQARAAAQLSKALRKGPVGIVRE